ncbi:hypothetical protein FACS1894191_1530 [Clostridia bacterium]|nr:hypothetical protein FACS1894191_1530 [Clostridia bacterium]
MARTDKKTVIKEAEVKNLTPAEQLVLKKKELVEAKLGLGSTLQNPHAIKNIKKDIARLLTKINTPTKGTK